MRSKTISFYDYYHNQNSKTIKVISRNNVTYWRIIRLIEKSQKSFRGKKVLDIGCGVGSLSFYLARLGAIVLGIDVSARAISLAKFTQLHNKLSLKFLHSALTSADDKTVPVKFIPNGFDLIICVEVIEHIKNDKKFLSACYSKLNSGGKLILTTQSKDNFLVKVGYFTKHDEKVGHLRRYYPNELVKMLENEGFTVELVQNADGIIRSIAYTSKLGFMLKFMRGPLNTLFQLIDQSSIYFFGAADIQVVAIKK